MPPSVAVIGSGLAGLTTAYLLSSCYEVTIIEKSPGVGVDIASVVTEEGIIIDSPMRGIQRDYYPSLFELVEHLGLETFITNVDANYYSWDGAGEKNLSFFGTSAFVHRLSPVKLPGLLFDWLKSSWFAKKSSLELTRLYITSLALKSSGQIIKIDETFGKYLDSHYYSSSFKYKFLAPFLCGIATCSVEEIMDYPASVLLDLIATYGTDIYQIKNGISSLVDKLVEPVSNTLFGITVVGCWMDNSGTLVVEDSKGTRRKFEKVVFATPVPSIIKILSASPTHGLKSLDHLTHILPMFKSVPVKVIVHSDPSILPADKKTWKSLNFAVDSEGETMATQWINSIQHLPPNTPDYFETSSIVVTPKPIISKSCILSEHVFVRGLVDSQSLDGINEIERLQGVNGIYVTGSWVWPGMPLLEGCIASSLRVADRLGVRRRFGGAAVVDGRFEGLVCRFLNGEMSDKYSNRRVKRFAGTAVCFFLQILTFIMGIFNLISKKLT